MKMVIVRAITAADSVLIEGVRTFLSVQGAAAVAIPFMSVLTVRADRVVAWRDYLDTTSLRK